MWVLVNANNILALLVGNATNRAAMKSRVKDGYEGRFSDHVQRYDELGLSLQERSAGFQLREMALDGGAVVDIGCGTGAVALRALECGASTAICGDISMLMMKPAMHKSPPKPGSLRFSQLDAEALPFADNSLDAALSGMTFGTLPDQRRALSEMIRVVKPGGLVCIGAHGPEHYWEAIDASFRCISKVPILGYRLEWWPRSETYLRRMASAAKLQDIHSSRELWKTRFPSGGAMYDFFAAISASWWYAMFSPEAARRDSERTRAYFERHGLDTITDDVIAVWGRKAA
jgi:ubiquinone/menaquinone biosynthesis C-methylase UbiE